MNAFKPVVKAILICDQVITEAGSNKKSIIGIFNNITFLKNPPWVHPVLSVYAQFSDAAGKYSFRLELILAKEQKKILELNIEEFIAKNRLDTYELIFNMRGLKFEQKGTYIFNLYANDQHIGQKDFKILKSK